TTVKSAKRQKYGAKNLDSPQLYTGLWGKVRECLTSSRLDGAWLRPIDVESLWPSGRDSLPHGPKERRPQGGNRTGRPLRGKIPVAARPAGGPGGRRPLACGGESRLLQPAPVQLQPERREGRPQAQQAESAAAARTRRSRARRDCGDPADDGDDPRDLRALR